MRRFNPEKELYKIQHGNRNRIIAFVFLLLVVSVVSYSFALYQVRYSKRIIYTKVAPFSNKDIQLAVKVKGEDKSRDEFPTQEEANQKGLIYMGIDCEKEGVTTGSWNTGSWSLDLNTKGPNKCTVTFGTTYTVDVAVESHGTVAPETQEVKVNGTSENFTIDLEEGYGIESITCDNNENVTKSYNTFKVADVTSDTKCTVKTIKEYVVTARVESNGGVIPDKQYVMPNQDSEEFSVYLDADYLIQDITCSNNQIVSRTGNTFKLTTVTNDSECTITMKEKTNTLFDYCSANEQLDTCIQKALELDNLLEDETTNKNIRYVGADAEVNNYIWFNCNNYSLVTDAETAATQNCEKWRIIGYMNDKKLVKIIRAESVGNMAWDSKDNNNWNRPATLQTSLISYYNGSTLSSAKGITSATQGMIEQVTWNIGGLGNSGRVSQFYTAERGSTGGGAAQKQITWSGYIGLMYPSDYGYATSGGDTYNRQECLDTAVNRWRESEDATAYNDCIGNDWLAGTGGNRWTLTPDSSPSFDASVWHVTPIGGFYIHAASATYEVYPSLYLKSSVKIKSGTGNSTNPYVLVP